MRSSLNRGADLPHSVQLREKYFPPLSLKKRTAADWALGKRVSNTVRKTRQLLARALRKEVLLEKSFRRGAGETPCSGLGSCFQLIAGMSS